MTSRRILPGSAGEKSNPSEPTPPRGSVSSTVSDGASEVFAAPALRQVHKSFFFRLYYGETSIDFVRRKRTWFAISAAVILAGVISLATQGLNLGIDFSGGTSWTLQSRTISVAQAKNAITPLGYGGAAITQLGNNTSSTRTINVQAKLPKGQTPAAQQRDANAVAAALAKLTGQNNINAVSINAVGPTWGSQITNKAEIALLVFFIMIALYISIFFEWRMALAAIIAVAHDILVTVGIYSLSGLQVTPDTVVAFLTILGYSLYDTIVVFDRVRDNTKNLSVRDRLTYSDVVNLSMNQTLARSINTSLVAVMPILAVLVLGAQILGATTLQYFGLALLVGLTTGAYSSIFIASPLVALMKEREPRYQELRARLVARGGDRVLLSPAMIAAGFDGSIETPERRSRPNVKSARSTTSTPRRKAGRGRAKGGRR
ncbi:MAG TPA: protein translocase subunit SecF [Acidimicrobiales bacterium]|nr:protein translocase subunit SecF [Acidimicrobiales bacterium]